MNDSLLWQVRHFIYNHFADTTCPPSVEATSRHFNIATEEASELYKELHNRHALFLEPGTLKVRMANPFSGIPTDFEVHTNGKKYYANCAWDMLGIPIALRRDAVIEAVCTESKESVRLEIRDERITLPPPNNVTLSDSEGSLLPKSETLRSQRPLPQSDILLVHFPLPFARWYDDLVFT